MPHIKRPFVVLSFFISGLCFLAWLSTPIQLEAQSPGNNGVYNSSTNVTGSPAYVDASVMSGSDICGQIASAYTAVPATGGVIDARGILPSGLHGGQDCTTTDPFASFTKPVTVLLPASTIRIYMGWTLPSNVRLIGDGPQTVIRDNAGVGTIIEMGTSCPSSGCTGVSVENLTIDGNGYNANGIVNGDAQDGSYVANVWFQNIGATSSTQTTLTTALTIAAPNSGPYSNIYSTASQLCQEDANSKCNAPNTCTCPATACVQIQASSRGLHGVTCSATSVPFVSGTTPFALPKAAIYLDASNTSIEDVHVEGFYDAVVVGDTPSSAGSTSTADTLVNISSADGQVSGPVYNTVHLCNSNKSYTGSLSACTQNASDPVSVSDVTILGARSLGGTSFNATTILDDLTTTFINSSMGATSVAVYSVGEPPVGSTSQYSRFTTAPAVPNWGIGGTSLLPDTVSCSPNGALYSNTTGVSTSGTYNSVYVCALGVWKPIA